MINWIAKKATYYKSWRSHGKTEVMSSCGEWFTHPLKWDPERTWWPIGWVTLCAFNGSLRCMLHWELRCVLGRNKSESGIIILYSVSEQGYLVLALYKHALLYIIINIIFVHKIISIFIKYFCIFCTNIVLSIVIA